MSPRPLFGRPPREKARPIVVVNFDKYNPLHKTVSKRIREGAPMDWYRQEVKSHRDQDILDMPPAQRFVWWVLLDLSGQQPRTPDGLRIVRMTPAQFAREADMPLVDVEAALRHLWMRKRIRYTTGGAKVAGGWQKGGEEVATGQDNTIQTSRARDEEPTTTGATNPDEPYAGTIDAPRLRGEAEVKTLLHRRAQKIA